MNGSIEWKPVSDILSPFSTKSRFCNNHNWRRMGINQILQSDMKIGVQSPPPIPQNNIHWDRLGVDMPLFMWILSFHLLVISIPTPLKTSWRIHLLLQWAPYVLGSPSVPFLMWLKGLTPPWLLRPESDFWKFHFPNTSLPPSWISKFSLPHPLPPAPSHSSFVLEIAAIVLSTQKPVLPPSSACLMEISIKGEPSPSTSGLTVEVTPSFYFLVSEGNVSPHLQLV